ncbi:hypothetical protein Vretimale_8420 [Volvox reticuliferus]|uniref:DNA polymerase eta n=1 Tax=Volvox reticuliferus TaxID=1737510 RepID=A0A8J4GB80_9CHLO|nr:hypothetical protein Vretifemale_11823 [Volvox reticuliferus]GIM03752.1 hypothetical protein Vretimale_8420 [Volvox reticuliferus]
MLLERRSRVIIHVDLDAFYCQVEQKRHGIPREVPCAVQQWEGLIAVNYAARAGGVTRHMRVTEAKKVCPQLRTIHVETIGEGDSLSPGRTQQSSGLGAVGGAGRRNEAKASLQPYRQASGEIMRVLGGLLGPGCLLEKASVDEAFLDVTPMVEEELRRLGPGAAMESDPGHVRPQEVEELFAAEHPDPWGYLPALEHSNDGDNGSGCGAGADDYGDGGTGGGYDGMNGAGNENGGGGGGCSEKGANKGRGEGSACAGAGAGVVCGSLSAELLAEARRVCEASVVLGGPLDLRSDTDRRLLAGAIIALRMRRAVRSELDFTCSAGVATNKLLAKVGSARNKPDKQTVVLPRGVPDLMQDMPLSKLRGLGGKLGASLEQHFGATNAGQAQQLSLEQLQRVLGERTGLWVSQVVRGQCSEPVTPKDKPKSLLSCKSFESTRDLGDLGRWLSILAEELAQRCREDEATHRRRARTLVLHYRGIGPRERSVRCPMPQHGREGPSPAVLAKAAMEMLRRQSDALPCSRLAIAATEFDDPPAAGAQAITRFFSAQPQHPPSALQHPLSIRSPGQRLQQQQQQGCREHQSTHEQPWHKVQSHQLQQEEHRQQDQKQLQQQQHNLKLSGDWAEGEGGEELTTWHGNDYEHADMCAGDESGEEYNEPYDDEEINTSHTVTDPECITDIQHARMSVQELGALHPQQGPRQLQNKDASEPRQAECQPLPRPCKRVRQWEMGGHGHGPLPGKGDLAANALAENGDAEAPGAARIAAAARSHDVGSAANLAEEPNEGDVSGYHCRDMAAPSGPAPRRVAITCQGDGRTASNPGTDLDSDIDPNAKPSAVDLLSDVDLNEQRRILHDIELARLRSLGRSSGSGTGAGAGLAGEAGGRGVAPGRRSGGGGVAGRGRGRASATTSSTKGQMRLTALLRPRPQNGS